MARRAGTPLVLVTVSIAALAAVFVWWSNSPSARPTTMAVPATTTPPPPKGAMSRGTRKPTRRPKPVVSRPVVTMRPLPVPTQTPAPSESATTLAYGFAEPAPAATMPPSTAPPAAGPGPEAYVAPEFGATF